MAFPAGCASFVLVRAQHHPFDGAGLLQGSVNGCAAALNRAQCSTEQCPLPLTHVSFQHEGGNEGGVEL